MLDAITPDPKRLARFTLNKSFSSRTCPKRDSRLKLIRLSPTDQRIAIPDPIE